MFFFENKVCYFVATMSARLRSMLPYFLSQHRTPNLGIIQWVVVAWSAKTDTWNTPAFFVFFFCFCALFRARLQAVRARPAAWLIDCLLSVVVPGSFVLPLSYQLRYQLNLAHFLSGPSVRGVQLECFRMKGASSRRLPVQENAYHISSFSSQSIFLTQPSSEDFNSSSIL